MCVIIYMYTIRTQIHIYMRTRRYDILRINFHLIHYHNVTMWPCASVQTIYARYISV